MCGLSAYIGKSPDCFKAKIMMLYNEERGGDSCGIYIYDKLFKDGDKDKKATSFIKSELFPTKPKNNKNKIFIAHNRKGSVGSNNTQNAHPHVINNDMIIVHNGTIKNIKDLCKKYEIEEDSDNDSYLLGKIIYEKGYSVLDDYKGFASLIWTKKSEPNVLYVFKGSSKTYDGTYAKVEEERPLFYSYDKNLDEYFISSLESAILAVSESKLCYKVLPNVIFKIDFNLKSTDRKRVVGIYKSNRGETNVNHGVNAYYTNSNFGKFSYDDCGYDYYGRAFESKKETATPVKMLPPQKKEKEKIEDHLIKNCFHYKVNNEQNYVSVKNTRYYLDDKLMHGIFNIDDDGVASYIDKQTTSIYYFFMGVMIKDHVSFQKLSRFDKFEINYSKKIDFALFISEFSKFPVLHSDLLNIKVENILYFENNIICKGKVKQSFSNQVISIENYILKFNYVKLSDDESSSFRNFIKNSKSSKTIESFIPYNEFNFNKTLELIKLPSIGNQKLIDFKGKKEIKPSKIYDKKFKNIKEAYTLTLQEVICLYLYIHKSLLAEKSELKLEEMHGQLFHLLSVCIRENKSIRENLEFNSKKIEIHMEESINLFNELISKSTISELRLKYGCDYDKLKEIYEIDEEGFINNEVEENEEDKDEEDDDEAKIAFEDAIDELIFLPKNLLEMSNALTEVQDLNEAYKVTKNFLVNLNKENSLKIKQFLSSKLIIEEVKELSIKKKIESFIS